MSFTFDWETETVSRSQPGFWIVLVDRSAVIVEPFPAGRRNSELLQQKSFAMAAAVNRLLNTLIKRSTVGATVKRYAHVAVLGYSGKGVTNALPLPLDGRPYVELPELNEHPARIEIQTKTEVDERGNVVEIPIHLPVWVEPQAVGGAPMCAALDLAASLAQQWAEERPDSFPPIVLNVTSGASTDGDPRSTAFRVQQVANRRGTAFLFNYHLLHWLDKTTLFPTTHDELPDSYFVRLLFDISSPLPPNAYKVLPEMPIPLRNHARGYVLNEDIALFATGLFIVHD